MNQLDLKLSATINTRIDVAAWDVPRAGIPQTLVIAALAVLAWGAVWVVARLMF